MNNIYNFMSTKKLLVAGIGGVAVVGVGIFMYVSRPLAAPSTNSAAPGTASGVAATAGEMVFTIDAVRSEAKYEIDETLGGNPVHVVGTTKDVSGQIVVNTAYPMASKVGPISVNARTFKTDSDRRDNTVGRAILKSEESANEFITFSLVKWFELPDKIEEGKEFPFSVIGNVTIAGKTQEVAFNGVVTKTGTTLVGKIESVIAYEDFGLTIPKLPFLAWVDNKVAISVNFTAVAQ